MLVNHLWHVIDLARHPPLAHISDVFHGGSNVSAPEYRAPEIG